MPNIEELEHRITKLEALYEDVLKERITHIASRLDQLYEKTERDKTEILVKIEQNKSELFVKVEQNKTDIYGKLEKDKRELIYWLIGLMLGFSALTITAIGIIISFTLKQ